VTTLATTPEFAAPKRQTQVIFTLTQSGANFVRVWVTKAPPGSDLRKQLDESTSGRIEVYAKDGGTSQPYVKSFEVGGKYTFVAQEYVKGAADYGGGYQDSPDGHQSETKVGSETTLPMYIGQRMNAEIRAGNDSVNLVCWVWNDTIRNTTRAVHGEDSPRLVKEKATDRERAALESSDVQDALDELIDSSVDDAIGDLVATLSDIVTNFTLHLTQATVHFAGDNENTPPAGLISSLGAYTTKDAVNELLKRFYYHYTNDQTLIDNPGRDTAQYHYDSVYLDDNANLPLFQSVNDKNAYWAIADLWRSYEAHRLSVSPGGSHLVADTFNPLADLPPLLEVANQVFAIWSSVDPVVPPTQSSGAMTLIASAGFTEKPL
jgi:hypothetical protein